MEAFFFFLAEKQFHVDPGPTALAQVFAHKVNPLDYHALFVTQQDLLHASDVNSLASAMTLHGMRKQGSIFSLATPEENAFMTNETKQFVEQTPLLESGKKFSFDDIDVQVLESEHPKGSCALQFTTPLYSVHYTGNTSLTPEVIQQHKDASILIVSLKHPSGTNEAGHLNVDDVIKLLSETKPQLAVLTSFGKELLQKNMIEQTREIQRASGVQTLAANDGLFLDPANYHLRLRQKTLKQF